MTNDLEVALATETVPGQLPLALPLAHLTAHRYLEAILRVGRLEPRPCTVMSKALLYFSYGGVFYRKAAIQTENATELPVALVFSPTVLSVASMLFPFDSGAADADRFGPPWSGKLAPFKTRFCVNTADALRDARRLVYHLFETNSRYLHGQPVRSGATGASILELLREFFSADLSAIGVDHRQRTIEALSEVAVELGKHVLWVGIPQYNTARILKALYQWTAPNVVDFYEYEFTRNFNPAHIAASLEQRARDCVIRRYADFAV